MNESTMIDWSARLALFTGSDSEIPQDVIFKIEDENRGPSTNQEVKAHRMVLAMASPVFMKMFYVSDTLDKIAKEIIVKKTTVEAFEVMVNAIYNTVVLEESLKNLSVEEMFAVLDLVVKYQIPELTLAVRKCLASLSVTKDSVLEIASAAMPFSTIFEEEANDLLHKCATFLRPKFTDVGSVFEFAAENETEKDIVYKLFSMVDSLPPLKCTNCD